MCAQNAKSPDAVEAAQISGNESAAGKDSVPLGMEIEAVQKEQ